MTEEEDIDGLAAEYVLGSLGPTERAGVAARRAGDRALAGAIAAWERRLAPLAEEVPDVPPPPHLLDRIMARIGAPSVRAAARARRRVLGVRVAIGAGALAACLALAAVAWLLSGHPGKPKTKAQVAAMDCAALYKDFLGKLGREKYARIPAEQLAGVSRMALRAYDACQAGDQLDAVSLFGRLHGMHF
jgi:anti-sigma-K factor RskA